VLDLCQCTGYFASVLVLATFAMRNMRLLRITAILSNIAFITYGVLYRLPPIIGLHLLLLLINLVRLIELYRAGREDQRNQLPWAPRIVSVVLIGAGVVFACQLAAHAEGRAWIGVTVGDASHHEDLVKLGWFSGVPVLEVHADSPAASAGIRAGDIIVEIDGQSLVSADELICRIAARFPGSQARLTTVHGTEIRYISLKLGSWPGDSFPSLLHCPPSVSWQPTLGAYSMRAVT
jgi:membrane-associated protease RseP (regulator of RpoE activity)